MLFVFVFVFVYLCGSDIKSAYQQKKTIFVRLKFEKEKGGGKKGGTQLFKSFEFGNGSRMHNKKPVLLEFKYLQNKKW